MATALLYSLQQRNGMDGDRASVQRSVKPTTLEGGIKKEVSGS